MSFEYYLKHRRLFESLFWVVFFTVVLLSNVVVVLMDFDRRGIHIAPWQPITWEASSIVMQLLLVPFIIWLERLVPLSWQNLRKRLLIHLGFSVVYSVIHVFSMVLLRQITYWWMGASYRFGDLPVEFVYEYTKDLRAYASYLAMIYLYRFIILRLQGEASSIGEGDFRESEVGALGERLLIKKLGREFLILTRDIERIEAAGNYVNIYMQGRVYPLRETMTRMEKRLSTAVQFTRVHRSHILNLDFLTELQILESGDAVAVLKQGDRIPVSRSYRKKLAAATVA